MNNEYIRDQTEAFQAYCSQSSLVVDPTISHWYKNLENVPGKGESYEVRFLSLTRPSDIIFLKKENQSTIKDTINHYRELGIEVINNEGIVFDQGGTWVKKKFLEKTKNLLVFLYDDWIYCLCGKNAEGNLYEATRKLEDKVRFTELFQTDNVLPRSVTVYEHELFISDKVWEMIGEKPGRIKGALCASGNDNQVFFTKFEFSKLMISWQGRRCVIQEDVGKIDVSMNYYINNNRLYFLFGTKQIVVNSVHKGNFESAQFNDLCRGLTDNIALKIKSMGFKGFFGFDLRVDPDQNKAWVIECNARITAPIYGWILKMKTGASWFGVKNIEGINSSVVKINDLVPKHLRYNANQAEGVVVHNVGPLKSEHMCGITVLADNQKRGEEIIAELNEYIFKDLLLVV